MNNEMDDFSAQPGKPNFFGLMGSQANAIGRQRPLNGMSPTLVSWKVNRSMPLAVQAVRPSSVRRSCILF